MQPQQQQQQLVHHSRSKHTNYRPPPPPVETIPSRKSTNSFSSPEPKLCQSPPEPHHQRIRSPSSPPPGGLSLVPAKSRIPYDTNERKPSLSPIPPEPRAKSPPAQFVVELRTRSASSQHNNGSPCSTTRPVNGVNGMANMVLALNGPPPVPEKRLDDVIYGKNALDRLRRLSKSTDKIPGACEDYFSSQYPNKASFLHNPAPNQMNGHDRAYVAPRHHYHQHHNPPPPRKTTASGAALPHQYARRVQSKPRPMSMVIPDSAPLFSQPPPQTTHDLFASPRSFGQNQAGDPYQHAYRSFVNLTMLDEPPPPPPPPPYHAQAIASQSLKATGTPPPPSQSSYYPQPYGGNLLGGGGRPVYQQRYTPRYYQAAYRV